MKTALIVLALGLLASFNARAQDTLNADWKPAESFPWQLVPRHDAVMVDSLRAYVVGGSSFDRLAGWIVRTRDGGATWELTEWKRRESYERISAFDQNRLLLFSVEHATGEDWIPPVWRIRKLEVGDTTGEPVWQYASIFNLYGPIWHGCFPDGSAYATVYYGTPTDSGHAVIRTRDFGTTWDTAYKVPRQDFEPNWHWFEAVYVPAPGVAHALHLDRQGRLSHIESSYDEGQSWRRTYEHQESITFRIDPLDFGGWIREGVFIPSPNYNLILLSDYRSEIMLKINLDTGEALDFPIRANGLLKDKPENEPWFAPADIHLFNDSVGVAVNAVEYDKLNMIFSTYNCGMTWQRAEASVSRGPGTRGRIHMLDERNGIILSNMGAIFITRNGGGLPVKRSETSDNKQISLYPNPNSGQFTISFMTPERSQLNVRVMDAMGRFVYGESLMPLPGTVKWSIDLPDGFNSGLYLLEFSWPTGQGYIKFIVE